MRPIQATRTDDDTKAPDGAFFISAVNKFGSVAVPACGLSFDSAPLPCQLDNLDFSPSLKALVESLTGESLPNLMPPGLRNRAEKIREHMWPDLSLDAAAQIEIVRHCHLHQRAPSSLHREWLQGHSPQLLAYLDSIAKSGPPAWRTVAERWRSQASTMEQAGVSSSARVSQYEHMLRALSGMCAIGSIALRKADEEKRAQAELTHRLVGDPDGLTSDKDDDQGGSDGSSGGGQKAKPSAPAAVDEIADDIILTPGEINAMGWGKKAALPNKNSENNKSDLKPGGLVP